MSEENTLSSASGGPLGEISQAPPALEVFLDRHQMKLIVLAVLLALFAIAYVVYEGIETSKQDSAGAQLVKAENISELQQVVNNNAGTAAADSAKILLAEKQWEDGQQDDAIETLETFVGGDAAHPARPSALASLATKLLSQGKADEAEEMFNEITADPDASYIAPYAWISLGDIQLAKGDKDAAAKAYETVEREYFDSPFSQQAMQRRLLLKAAPPVEVAAPITVPDVNLTGEADGTAPETGRTDDLIDAIKGGIANPDSNPLLPTQENPE
jgi:predicted negative regulator of RcsB-dependent stress response